MGTYLEDYLESMYMLPSEIKRNFDLMRELDKTSYPLIEELRASHRAFLLSARAKVAARCADTEQPEPTEQELRALVEADAHLSALHETHTRVVQKLDEKVAIAAQSYDVVDHHIRRLDADLDAYASLLRANGEFEEDKSQRKRHKASASTSAASTTLQPSSQTPQAPSTAASSSSAQYTPQPRSKAAGGPAKGSSAPASSNTAGGGSSSAASGTSGRDRTASVSSTATTATGKATGKAGASGGASTSSSGSRKRSAAEAALDVAAHAASSLAVEDMPIDPNEPIYCSCRRVSFGQMVGCDNDDCKYEWFHFGCVGLADQPQGKWYCPDCRSALGIK